MPTDRRLQPKSIFAWESSIVSIPWAKYRPHGRLEGPSHALHHTSALPLLLTRVPDSALTAMMGGPHSRHGTSHCTFRRPAGHAIPGGQAQLTQPSTISAQFSQKPRERLQISAGINEARIDRSD